MTVLTMPRAASPGHDLLDSALAQLDRAAKANLDPGMHRFLQQSERTLIVAVERVASAITKRGIFP